MSQLPDARLAHVVIIQRHHARTPDNLSPVERDLGGQWNEHLPRYAVVDTLPVRATLLDDPAHPFAGRIWSGSASAGSLTRRGFEDAVRHGEDVWAVYAGRLGLSSVDDVDFRTSSEARTIETAAGVARGMQPDRSEPVRARHQPAPIDSLVPAYPCPEARQLEAAIRREPAWLMHRQSHRDLFARLNAVFGTSDLPAWSDSADHLFDALTARECDGRPRPCRDGRCVDEHDVSLLYEVADAEAECVAPLEPRRLG